MRRSGFPLLRLGVGVLCTILLVGGRPAAQSSNAQEQSASELSQLDNIKPRVSDCAEKVSADTQTIEKKTFELGNEERQKIGAPDLVWNNTVALLAREHSCRMAALGFFSHFDPERGEEQQRLQAAGILAADTEENLFKEKGQTNPALVAVESWMHSPSHRKNLLESQCRYSGIGISAARDSQLYFTQLFLCGALAMANPECSLTADPTSIDEPGAEVSLTWEYPKGSSDVVLKEGLREIQKLATPAGSVTVKPRATTTYTLTGKGPDGKELKCRVSVALKPFECKLCYRYDAKSRQFTLYWTAHEKATSATLRAFTVDDPPKEIPGETWEVPAGKVASGEREVDPATSRSYQLTISAKGMPERKCTVPVRVPTCVIWAEPARNGKGYELRWRKYDVSSTNWKITRVDATEKTTAFPDARRGERITFQNEWEGGASVSPTEDTTYTLTVTRPEPKDSCNPRAGTANYENQCEVTIRPLSCSLDVEPRQLDTKGKPTKVDLTWTSGGQKAVLQTYANGNPSPPVRQPQPQPPKSEDLPNKKLSLDVTQTTEFVMTVTGATGKKATCHACVLNRPAAQNEKNPEVKVLNIPPKFQQKPMWCWLTVAQMIFQYQEPPVPKFNPWRVYSSKAPEPKGLDSDTEYQWGILAAVHPECWMSPDSCAMKGGGSSENIQRMLQGYPPKATTDAQQKSPPLNAANPKGCLDARTIKEEIQAGRPIIVGISPGAAVAKPTPEHVALIIGYQEDDKGNLKLIINDPWPFQLQKGGFDPYVKAGGTRNCEANYTIDLNDLCRKLGWSESFIGIQPAR